MYIYFDENGTIKEVVNDKSIRQGSNEANKLYCYIDGNPSIDDIWYLQKNVDGSLTNEISFKNSTVTKAIPYDAKRDMRYFKDFETYNFYVFTLTTNYLKQSGLVSGTIRIVVDNEIFALGELKFNVQENVINITNNITQSQYDYLLLAYASRTLNEETGSDLDHLLDEKIDAKLGDIADGSPRVFDTTAHIQALTSDMGVAVATDTGYIWVWNDTDEEYKNTGYIYLANVSAYYTKTEADNTFAKKSANNTFTGNNTFNGETTFTDDIEIGGGDINQVNGSYSTNGNVEAQSMTIDGTNLEDMFADKSDTYSKSEVDGFLNDVNDEINLKANSSDVYTKDAMNTFLNAKADKSDTYTKSEVNTMLNNKADVSTVNGINNRVGSLETEVGKLQSVQNVVDVVATKNDLNNYPTSDLEIDDKIQVIADESQGGASTIYNWNGSAWEYVGAFGGNSYTKDETLQQIDLHKLVNKTYAELQTMKTNGTLVAGQLYRITDYVTKTNGKCNNIANDVRSTEYPFDIILRAISTTEFSEQARAIWHSGDTYFANSELQAWKLWYCFDNDSVRFEWADTSTGKGVIYRMIDEFGNDLPYDFKNIQFKRYKITATSDQRQALFVGKYLGFSGNYAVVSDSSDYVWYYTFSKRSDGSDLSLTETTASDIANSYYVKQVIIGQYLTDTPNYRGAQALNNIIMEADNIIVDVQMGAGSHHNTWIGNKDIDYCYFREMFRQNILFGEINHTRADECFERNVMGEGHYSNYTSCWNKFSHHFSQNTSLNLQSNDFENQVGNCKFPEHFTRNHISNMWDNVNAGTHDTFNRCEFGYMVNVTLSGAGDWDSVKTIMCYNVTIKIANFFGSNLGRMEYVSISEGEYNNFNILNLTIGAIYGSSSKILSIALTDLDTHNLQTSYQKRIDFAYDSILQTKVLIYLCTLESISYNIIDYDALKGGISSVDGSVTWSALDSLSTKFGSIATALGTKMTKGNPDGTGAMTMNGATASNYGYANGSGATASGIFSRAIGFGAQASGGYSLAVMGNASGSGAIAIGNMANASGDTSKALGTGTKAKGDNQTVIGKFNIPDTDSLEIVGNGAYMNTKNARVLDGNGNEFLAGDLYLDTTFTKDSNGDLLSKQGMSVKQTIKNIQSALEGNLYNETTDNGIAYEIALSNPLPYGKVNKIGGMSYKSENLIAFNNIAETTTNGITYKAENGVITINGTTTARTTIDITLNAQLNTGTYSCNCFNADYSANNQVVFDMENVSGETITYVSYMYGYGNATRTITLSNTVQMIRIIIPSGLSFTNASFKPMIISGSTAPTTWSEGFSGIRNTAVSQLTIRGANLLQLSDVAETTTNGITYSINNGVFSIVGTASERVEIRLTSFNFGIGTYSVKVFDTTNLGNVNVRFFASAIMSNSNLTSTTLSNTFSVQTEVTSDFGFVVPSGANVNATFKYMLVKGSTAPTEYKPYVTPIIKNIPPQIQALNGYGMGFDTTSNNYLDYDYKKFVKPDNLIDLGTLTWTYDSTVERFTAVINDLKYSTTRTAKFLCAIYQCLSNQETFDINWDNVIYNAVGGGINQVAIHNHAYTDATAFKNAMSGVYLLYELETPIETDVSQYLTDENYDVLPNLEPNGSIVLDNTYQQEAVYDITTLEKVSV